MKSVSYCNNTLILYQPLCRSSKHNIWKKTRLKLSAVTLYRYITNTSEVWALYLVSIDYGVQTAMGFSKHQLMIRLCQMLQHLSSKYKTLPRSHFLLSIVHRDRHTVELTWSTLRQAVEMLTICSCIERRSLTRSRNWLSSKPRSCASETCLSSLTPSSKQRSLVLFTLLLFNHNQHIIQKRWQICLHILMVLHLKDRQSFQTCWG